MVLAHDIALGLYPVYTKLSYEIHRQAWHTMEQEEERSQNCFNRCVQNSVLATRILFPFVVFLIAKYSINYSKKLVVLLLLMTIIPTIYSSLLMFDHFRRSTTFLSKLHFPTALEIKNSKEINSVAVWETGIISYFLSNEKKIIDIYGLGTTRYAILNHGFRLDKLKQFLNDKPDALVSWSSSLPPEPGLDENNGISIKKHFTVSLDSQIYYMKNNYPQKMSTYLLTYR